MAIPTLASWVLSLAAWLDEDDLAEVRIGLLRISDDLRSLTPEEAAEHCQEAPPSTGHPGVDASLASLVEFTAVRAGLRPPGWSTSAPAAAEPFFIVSNRQLRSLVISSTPEVFAKRNVWVSLEYFESA